MTSNIFALIGDLIGKIVLVCFLFCREYVVGTQKVSTPKVETVLLSTQNVLKLMDKKVFTFYAHIFVHPEQFNAHFCCFSRPMDYPTYYSVI